MEFKVIKGGKDPDGKGYTYAGGCVTDTRLMGVLGLHLHWKTGSQEGPADLHQFIYYDIEEIGIDNIKVSWLDDEAAAVLAEKAAFGGLGAKMVPVSEKEARYLVCSFAEGTKKKGQPLPENADSLAFILADPPRMDEKELKSLSEKMCVEIKTDFGAVNYYLMRVFGKDSEGAGLLKKDGAPEDAFDDVSLPSHATFLRNSIVEFTDESGRKSYLAETLAESRNSYHICVSELWIEDRKVVSVKKRSQMAISPSEASLLLSTEEYVSVFEIETDMDYFDMLFAAYSVGTTKTDHDTGEMYMEFQPDNRHAEKPLFRLSDHVFAIYYSTDFGQLILGAYSPGDIMRAEAKLSGFFDKELRCTGRYHFAQSVIYEFALSGFDDFDAFISSIE